MKESRKRVKSTVLLKNHRRKVGMQMDFAGLDAALGTVSQYDSTSAVNSASLAYTVGVEMLDKSLELNQALSDGMVKMMENSVTPYLGGNIDTYV